MRDRGLYIGDMSTSNEAVTDLKARMREALCGLGLAEAFASLVQATLCVPAGRVRLVESLTAPPAPMKPEWAQALDGASPRISRCFGARSSDSRLNLAWWILPLRAGGHVVVQAESVGLRGLRVASIEAGDDLSAEVARDEIDRLAAAVAEARAEAAVS
jgi:hypothetical protein